jgi:transposase
VATVAMAHGINANLVHKWRRDLDGERKTAASFIPVTVGTVVSEPPQFIEFEVQRGATSVRVRWPMSNAGACASWLREILR